MPGPGEPLIAAYEGLVCDLDGVVYRGPDALPYAVSALRGAAACVPVCFATNNASRSPAEVAAQLRQLGLMVADADVVTSAQAGARLLAAELPPGSAVLAVGGDGVWEALAAAGLGPTREGVPVRAVLQGWGSEVRVADLANASIAIADGARWIATNTDRTLPTSLGEIPGNGTLVAAVVEATGRTPEVVGKPFPPLYHSAAERLGTSSERCLMIGDRLDTDIVGASAVGADALWVFTGVDRFTHLARSAATPRYAAPDLRALGTPAVQVCRHDEHSWTCDGAGLALGKHGLVCSMNGHGCELRQIPPSLLAMLGLGVVLHLRDERFPVETELASVAAELDWALDHCVEPPVRQ